MAIDYSMPKLAMAMNEGTINEWLVSEGDYVEKGQILATIETEKVAYDVESPDAGYFHIVVPVGETVDCETLVAQFAASEEELAELQVSATASQGATANVAGVAPGPVAEATPIVPATPAKSSGGRIKASPLARKMAGGAGLDLALVNGTGPGGRIVKRDVLAAQERGVGMAPVEVVGERILARVPNCSSRAIKLLRIAMR